jgi:hypothetical protein
MSLFILPRVEGTNPRKRAITRKEQKKERQILHTNGEKKAGQTEN